MRDCYSAYPVRAHAYLIPLIDVVGHWLLSGIEVGHEARGKGVARELMKQVLADADAEQVTLYLSVRPDGTGLDTEQLRRWYSRLGFVHDPEMGSEGYPMIRKPVPLASVLASLHEDGMVTQNE